MQTQIHRDLPVSSLLSYGCFSCVMGVIARGCDPNSSGHWLRASLFFLALRVRKRVAIGGSKAIGVTVAGFMLGRTGRLELVGGLIGSMLVGLSVIVGVAAATLWAVIRCLEPRVAVFDQLDRRERIRLIALAAIGGGSAGTAVVAANVALVIGDGTSGCHHPQVRWEEGLSSLAWFIGVVAVSTILGMGILWMSVARARGRGIRKID